MTDPRSTVSYRRPDLPSGWCHIHLSSETGDPVTRALVDHIERGTDVRWPRADPTTEAAKTAAQVATALDKLDQHGPWCGTPCTRPDALGYHRRPVPEHWQPLSIADDAARR